MTQFWRDARLAYSTSPFCQLRPSPCCSSSIGSRHDAGRCRVSSIGLHADAVHDPVLARLSPGLLHVARQQHDADGRLRRQDLAAGHLLQQRHGFAPARRHRTQPHDSPLRRRIRRLRTQVDNDNNTAHAVACN